LKQDVQRWLDGLPIVARSISSVYLLRKIVSRHRYTASVLGLLLVIIAGFSTTSFQLYRRSQRTLAALQEEQQALGRQSERNYLVDRRLTLVAALEAWRRGQIQEVAVIARFLGDDESMEKKSVAFLLNAALTEERQENFRHGLGEGWGWFADFLIGEKLMRTGRPEQAKQAYRRSYETMPQQPTRGGDFFERLLEVYARARVIETALSEGRPETAIIEQKGGTAP